MAKSVNVNKAVADLVERSRLGDQNAMGMIAAVYEAAQDPNNAKANQALSKIQTYCYLHPPKKDQDDVIGPDERSALEKLKEEVPSGSLDLDRHHNLAGILFSLPIICNQRALNAATVILANGSELVDDRILMIADALTDTDAQASFINAVVNDNAEDDDSPYTKAGLLIGAARSIQIGRRPNTPLSVMSPASGWEHGE